ncbi:MAG: hypothetical protein AAB778_03415 [Patescibacteria group bacterium]
MDHKNSYTDYITKASGWIRATNINKSIKLDEELLVKPDLSPEITEGLKSAISVKKYVRNIVTQNVIKTSNN